MYKFTYYLLIFLLSLASPLFAQTQPQKALPQVLIIGDSVYNQAQTLKQDLKDKANVTFAKWPETLLPSSSNAIEKIDILLGFKDLQEKEIPQDKRPVWNIIYLNVGLGDLIYRVPGLKTHRSMSYDLGGVITTTNEEYQKNLEKLIGSIKNKAPQAKLIWLSTTPIIQSTYKWFKPGSEIEYNKMAAQVMQNNKIQIIDMHAHILSVLTPKDKSEPFSWNAKQLTPPLLNSILKEITP